MKISLNGFSDCGKCSFGTLLDDYDTDDNLIYLDHKEVKIEKVEDLFPFVWQHAGISTKDGNIIKINAILDKWGNETGIYQAFKSEGSRINYKKAIFLYIAMSIQKYT